MHIAQQLPSSFDRSKMCSYDNAKVHAFASDRTILPNDVQPAVVLVSNGKILDILDDGGVEMRRQLSDTYPGITFHEFGSLVLMPGIVDSHVHVNEPGRTEWEGFHTATRAAASGGVTTIVDMPLNSIPPTTSVDRLRVKASAARGRVFVDVAFWGGVIPGNQGELRPLVDAGVVGFKCFLCPSGVDEFPMVDEDDVRRALTELKLTNSVLAFHAECERDEAPTVTEGDPRVYETFLSSRPSEMENRAIRLVCNWCREYNVRCHIVHLSSADSLDIVQDAKQSGAMLTAETCHHYLTLSADEIPNGETQFKCCPPIRQKTNQDKLWAAIKNQIIDMVVSDHSPCVAELKASGDFINAWGGISSLQFGLPLLWTGARMRGIGLLEVSSLLSNRPAKLCQLDGRKGALAKGMDADFVIWDPEKSITVRKDDIFYKNKLTPYEGRVLYGKVIATILRGQYVFQEGKFSTEPVGALLLNADAH